MDTDSNPLTDAYMALGLSEEFAAAIASGQDADAVIKTWKAAWRKGLPDDHPAIKAVLNGKASPEEAESLIAASHEHPELVTLVADGTKTMKWVVAVLDGFKGMHHGVEAIIGGADPKIVANFLDVEVNSQTLKIIKEGGEPIPKIDVVINQIEENIQRSREQFASMSEEKMKETLKKSHLKIGRGKKERIERYNRFLNLLSQISKNSVDPAISISGPYVTEKLHCNVCNGSRLRHGNRARDYCWDCRREVNPEQPRINNIKDITDSKNFETISVALGISKSKSKMEKLQLLRKFTKQIDIPLMISKKGDKIVRTTIYEKGSSNHQQSNDYRKL